MSEEQIKFIWLAEFVRLHKFYLYAFYFELEIMNLMQEDGY